MARDVESGVATALAAKYKRPFYLLEMATSGATLRYSTLSRDITWDSQTWLGNGLIKNISGVRETQDIGVEGVQIDIAGEPSSIVSLALQSLKQNKIATLRFGFLDTDDTVIPDPFVLFKGIVDSCSLIDAPEEATVSIFLESEIATASRPSGLRYNHESQQELHSGDLLLEYMEQLQDWSGYWGRPNRVKKKNRRGS